MSRPEVIYNITCIVCGVVHNAAAEYVNYVCSDCATYVDSRPSEDPTKDCELGRCPFACEGYVYVCPYKKDDEQE